MQFLVAIDFHSKGKNIMEVNGLCQLFYSTGTGSFYWAGHFEII